ncbi:uncharacterized protein TNCV_1903561 [Trichonephila clavipes]|nr:uncharacterized protein TNCV_1903561 [Trichonephila clavipes]
MVVLQAIYKVTCQNSVDHVALNSGMRVCVTLLEKSPLNAVQERQYYRLNYETDVKICSQCVWDNDESAPTVIRNCSPGQNSGVGPICLGHIQLQNPSDQHTAINDTKAENTTDLHSALQSSVT